MNDDEPLDLEFNPFTNQKEPGYNVKADGRLAERLIPCAYCVHRIHIVNPYHARANSTCKAYPTGIPWPIQEGKWNHNEVANDQEGDFIYESEKAASAPDGHNYITFDGEWVTKETIEKGAG